MFGRRRIIGAGTAGLPVFVDDSGRRARILRWLTRGSVAALLVAVTGVALTLTLHVPLPRLPGWAPEPQVRQGSDSVLPGIGSAGVVGPPGSLDGVSVRRFLDVPPMKSAAAGTTTGAKSPGRAVPASHPAARPASRPTAHQTGSAKTKPASSKSAATRPVKSKSAKAGTATTKPVKTLPATADTRRQKPATPPGQLKRSQPTSAADAKAAAAEVATRKKTTNGTAQ